MGKLILLPGPGPVYRFRVQVSRFLVWLLSAVYCLWSGSDQMFRLLSGLYASVYSIICILSMHLVWYLFLVSVILVWRLIWCAVSHPVLWSGLVVSVLHPGLVHLVYVLVQLLFCRLFCYL